MRAVFSSTLAVITFCGCAAAPVQIPEENVRSKVLHYPDFSKYLEARTQAPVYQIRFQRDSIGSKLFISFYFRKGNEPAYRTLIVTGDGIREVPGYAAVWYDDLGNPVIRLEGGRAWYDNEGRFFSRFEDAKYILKSGAVIPYKETSGIGAVSGRDFLIGCSRDKPGCIISSFESPRQPLIELPKDLDHLQRAYANADEIIIFGTWRPADAGHIVKCLIYRGSPTGYWLSEEIPIPWAGNVYDLYPKSGDALISGTATKFAGYYRFNIRTKKRTRLAAAADESLFLKEDVIRTLDAAMRESK